MKQQILAVVAVGLLATLTSASAQIRPQQTPESATGTKTDQEQGESKAQRQGLDVERGPGLPSDNTSETQH